MTSAFPIHIFMHWAVGTPTSSFSSVFSASTACSAAQRPAMKSIQCVCVSKLGTYGFTYSKIGKRTTNYKLTWASPLRLWHCLISCKWHGVNEYINLGLLQLLARYSVKDTITIHNLANSHHQPGTAAFTLCIFTVFQALESREFKELENWLIKNISLMS